MGGEAVSGVMAFLNVTRKRSSQQRDIGVGDVHAADDAVTKPTETTRVGD